MKGPIRIPRELLEKYATSAPRYTSYPTAVDWSGDFEPARYPDLLRQAADKTEPLSVYVHIPFCSKLCLFCGCNVTVSRNQDRIGSYVEALKAEFASIRESGIGERPVRQYHWGGGTPTHLNLDQIARVQAAFEATFTLADDAEVAIEVDPRVTTAEQIELLAGLGFNRISLGLQDFEQEVQEAVARVQSEEQTVAVIETARRFGMGSTNVDLMYGLPHQTEKSFEATVERVLDIRPERVALFHYAHVPWLKKHQTALDFDAFPTSEQKIEIFTRSVHQFQEAGYVYIGLDHFALPDDELAVALAEGSLERNFMGYTTRRGSDMVSLGVSSIGDVSDCYIQNSPQEPEYKERIRKDGVACIRGYQLSAEDRLRRDVILGLMCNGVLEKKNIEEKHGIDFDTTFERELTELESLEKDGLIVSEKKRLRLTKLGQVFMRNVALPFDVYYRARKEQGGDSKKTFSKTL